MSTQHEPSDQNIDRLCATPGTHYFNVVSASTSKVRHRIYDQCKAQGTKVHTKYDKTKESLRVVITNG